MIAVSAPWGSTAYAGNRNEQAEQTAQKIMDDDGYLYGTGTGADRQEAMQAALSEMIGKERLHATHTASIR